MCTYVFYGRNKIKILSTEYLEVDENVCKTTVEFRFLVEINYLVVVRQNIYHVFIVFLSCFSFSFRKFLHILNYDFDLQNQSIGNQRKIDW